MKKTKIKWFGKPQKHDYPAAQSYLSLTFDPKTAQKRAEKLKRAKMTEFAAKDIFRASGLALLAPAIATCKKIGLRSFATNHYLRCCCAGKKSMAG